jgi:hypothetical protein
MLQQPVMHKHSRRKTRQKRRREALRTRDKGRRRRCTRCTCCCCYCCGCAQPRAAAVDRHVRGRGLQPAGTAAAAVRAGPGTAKTWVGAEDAARLCRTISWLSTASAVRMTAELYGRQRADGDRRTADSSRVGATRRAVCPAAGRTTGFSVGSHGTPTFAA